jgi:cytochrome c5
MTALGLAIASLYACSSGPALSADQNRGKRIYESLCDKCHKLISPQTHTDGEWGAAADKYGVKLKLQPNEVALLKAYLNRANDADFR